MAQSKSRADAPLLRVYYDGACSLSRTRIAIYKLAARRAALPVAWHDLAQEPDALAEFGLADEEARARLHVVDADGALFAGVDAFALLWSALPGYRRLGRLVVAPGFNALARAVCDGGFARAAQRLRRDLGRRAGRPAAEGRA
jgi:predicted DCC family thiol-disulfide oxidoreductase YuxK